MSESYGSPASVDRLRSALADLFGVPFADDQLLVNVTVIDSLMLAEVIAAVDEILVPEGFSPIALSDVDPHVLTFDRLIELASASTSEDLPIWATIEASVLLRPVDESDVGWLRDLVLRPEDAHRFIFRGRFGPPHAFLEDLTGGMAASFAVLERASSTPIGFAGLTGLNLQAGHAHVALAYAQPVRRTQFTLGGFLAVCRYGFANFPLRKLYAQVADYNLGSLGPREPSLLHEEARLDEHEYYDGRIWGVTWYSLSRARFHDLVGPPVRAGGSRTAVGPDGWAWPGR